MITLSKLGNGHSWEGEAGGLGEQGWKVGGAAASGKRGVQKGSRGTVGEKRGSKMVGTLAHLGREEGGVGEGWHIAFL